MKTKTTKTTMPGKDDANNSKNKMQLNLVTDKMQQYIKGELTEPCRAVDILHQPKLGKFLLRRPGLSCQIRIFNLLPKIPVRFGPSLPHSVGLPTAHLYSFSISRISTLACISSTQRKFACMKIIFQIKGCKHNFTLIYNVPDRLPVARILYF